MLLLALALAQDPAVPEGFSIEKVSPAEVAFPMFACFDDRGRLYVTESSGGDLYVELQQQVRKCRIRRLDGGASTVFAEGLVPSMGIAWRDGRIYAADPPDLVTLEDTDGDGRADRRTVILTGFGAKDNGSLHGLVFGPDGLLYMTTGQPDGYDLRGLRGVSGALLRCAPDGTGVEVIARGFENLVEVAWLPNGDVVGTVNWFQKPSGGIRDALVHLLDGGLYPYVPDQGTKLPVSGVRLPALSLFPAVALSGLVRRGPDLFSAQHNTRKVQRHVLRPSGSTWASTDLDFVTSENPDFHPSDVLLAPDGSLWVVDTGGWYVEHCPTGKIRKSLAKGGIWRVGFPAPPPPDPPAAPRAPPEDLVEALTEDVDAHQEHRLVHALRGKLKPDAFRHPHPRVRKAALFLLDAPRDAVLAAVGDRDPELRAAGLALLQQRKDWAADAAGLVRGWIEAPGDGAALRGCVLAFQADPAIQAAVAEGLRGPARALLLETIAETSLKEFPKAWEAGLRDALDDPAAVRAIAALRLTTFDEQLAGLLDLDALRAIVPRRPRLGAKAVDFLLERLADRGDAPGRLAAAEILRRAHLKDVDLVRGLRAVKGDPLISPSLLLAGLREVTDAAPALAAEVEAAVASGWRPSEDEIKALVGRLPVAAPALRGSREEAAAKLARFEGLLAGGDGSRGREVFFNKRAACGQCHAVGTEGGRVGPDLTKIGAIRAGRDLLESVLVPSSTFAQGYEPYVIATADGDVLAGLIAGQSSDAVVLRDAAGKETRVRRERIRDMKRGETSLMPDNLEQAMSEQEFRDLLAFLQSLK